MPARLVAVINVSAENVKANIMALVIGIILLIVGSVAGDVTSSVGEYIINQLTSTGNFTRPTTFTNDVFTVVGPVFTILGVVLIVVASVTILRELLAMVSGFTKGAT